MSNLPEPVMEALEVMETRWGGYANAKRAIHDHIAALTTRVAELETAEREAFQKYVDANEARIDAEAKAEDHARDAGGVIAVKAHGYMQELEAFRALLAQVMCEVDDENSCAELPVSLYDAIDAALNTNGDAP